MAEIHLGAGTIIKDEAGGILLVKEGKEQVKGHWNIPSGVMRVTRPYEKQRKGRILKKQDLK